MAPGVLYKLRPGSGVLNRKAGGFCFAAAPAASFLGLLTVNGDIMRLWGLLLLIHMEAKLQCGGNQFPRSNIVVVTEFMKMIVDLCKYVSTDE